MVFSPSSHKQPARHKPTFQCSATQVLELSPASAALAIFAEASALVQLSGKGSCDHSLEKS